jgi:hypothetical protein
MANKTLAERVIDLECAVFRLEEVYELRKKLKVSPETHRTPAQLANDLKLRDRMREKRGGSEVVSEEEEVTEVVRPRTPAQLENDLRLREECLRKRRESRSL